MLFNPWVNDLQTDKREIITIDANQDAVATFHRASLLINPAQAYLSTLTSRKSRRTMYSFLNKVTLRFAGTSIDHFDWSKLDRYAVRAVMEWLSQQDKAPATINTYLSALKGVAREAWLSKLIDSDTHQNIKAVKGNKGTRLPKGRALTHGELRALFSACETYEYAMGIRDSAILSVLAGCGLRRAEVAELKVKSVNFSEMTLIVHGKGNKERESFMPKATCSMLRRWCDEVRGDADGPLFTRIRKNAVVTDKGLSDQAIYFILERMRQEAGVRPFTPHDLRRTFASALLDNNEDLLTVRDAMGHASVVTTQKYDKRGKERLRKASQKLDFF